MAALALAGAAGYAMLTGGGLGGAGSGTGRSEAGRSEEGRSEAGRTGGGGGTAPHAGHAEIDEPSRQRLREILREADRAERED